MFSAGRETQVRSPQNGGHVVGIALNHPLPFLHLDEKLGHPSCLGCAGGICVVWLCPFLPRRWFLLHQGAGPRGWRERGRIRPVPAVPLVTKRWQSPGAASLREEAAPACSEAPCGSRL